MLAISGKRFTKEVILRGSVSEADRDRMTFELQPVYGNKVSGPIPEQHLDTIIEAFNGYRDGIRVLVQGVGRHDRQNRLLSLESIEHINPLDPLDVPAQLDDLRNLKDGWYDGYGKAPSHEGLDWLAHKFMLEYPDTLPRPYIYPTPEGGVQMEWSIGVYDVSLELDISKQTGDWHNLNMRTIEADTRTLRLADSSDWDWLNAEIGRMMESQE